MAVIDIKDTKIVDGIMYVKNDNDYMTIRKGNAEGGDNAFYLLFYKGKSEIIDRRNPNFEKIDLVFQKYKKESEVRDFVTDILLERGIGKKGKTIVEIQSKIEQSQARRLARRGMETMMVDPHLYYESCAAVGFTHVLTGGVLTGNKNLWVANHNLSDNDGVFHPDVAWAKDKIKKVNFEESTLLCLSRRVDISKLVSIFGSAFIGVYGIEGTEAFKWTKSAFEKEERALNNLIRVNESRQLEDGRVATLRLLIK